MKKTLLFASLLCMLLVASTAQARHRDCDLERIRIEGRIESIRGQIAYIDSDCGRTYRVHLGPAWYWDEHDYYLRSGDWVTVIAWFDTWDDYCYAGEIRGYDFCYDLCDSRGFPRWRDRHECHANWRPTRSFFEICFVIGGPVWNWDRPRYRDHHCNSDCRHEHNRHRHWRSGDDDRGRDRDGRRGRDGGGRHNLGDNDDRRDVPIGGFNSQVEMPRYSEKRPGNDDNGGKSYKVEPRYSEKPRYMDKPRENHGSGSSKSVTKSYRKENKASNKTYARK